MTYNDHKHKKSKKRHKKYKKYEYESSKYRPQTESKSRRRKRDSDENQDLINFEVVIDGEGNVEDGKVLVWGVFGIFFRHFLSTNLSIALAYNKRFFYRP